ncbi:MAG: hypothetical protein GVY25_14055, partial [Bacteroidetes bacterium]|nr:hypothetical protein [Bacteroidota bacterium]
STGNIYTVRPDGSDLRQVTDHGSAFFPSWSPDGKRLAYDATSLPKKGTWLVSPGGSGRRHLGFGRDPDWAPSGKRLVFQWGPETDSEDQIWAADTSRTDSTKLTDNDFVSNRDPAWSPNGEWIAWSPGTDEGLAVSVMRADGSDPKRLVEAPAAEPSWAPDSKRLVFIKPDPETGRTALWTIRRDGTDLRQITDPSRNPLN